MIIPINVHISIAIAHFSIWERKVKRMKINDLQNIGFITEENGSFYVIK